MNHLSADNSLKLNLRSICVSCCKIDSKLNCSSFYKNEIKLIHVLNLYSCYISKLYLYDEVTETLNIVKGPEA